MKKTQKGLSKIVLLILIAIVMVISAIAFGYGGEQVQDVKQDAQVKAQEIIDEKGGEVIANALEGGQQVIGKTLKETGEKMLAENTDPGFYGVYRDDGVGEYLQTVLFFTADWCPSCVDADKKIQEYEKQIPANVAIVKVDFDDDEGLREVYGVNKQHTFVLIDSEGKEIKRWQNSKTLNEIIDNIN